MGRKRKRPAVKRTQEVPTSIPEQEEPKERAAPNWRVRLAAFAVLIAAGPLFVVLLEFGLGLTGYGYPTDFFLRTQDGEAYITNSKFGWRFFPPAIARFPVVSSIPARKEPDTYRIFVLGGSAAMGIPDSGFSFGEMLREMLQQRYPGVRFQMINAAMTAINSHVVLPIASECARLEPDLFIVYVGNNEVVGPYGPGTVFARNAHRALIRAGIWFGSTKTSQLVQNAAALVHRPESAWGEWEGMEMFVDRLVPADDLRMEKVYEYYRENLADTCRVGLRAGADVIVATVATNLKDNPPFASLHRDGLSNADRARWQTLYDGARESSEAGEYATAVEQLSEAVAIDDRYADLHFLLAEYLLALDRPEEAREHFILARDLDALRFRADSRLNQVVRDVTADMATDGVRLVDIESAFERSDQSQYGIPGDELLYEHVHMNFSGNYLLARELLPTVEASLPSWITERSDGSVLATESEVADLLVYTDWDRFRLSLQMFQLMERPPFTGQLGYRQKMTFLERELDGMGEKWASPGAFLPIREKYLSALEREPEDLELRVRLANVLTNMGDLGGAAEQWRSLIGRVPGVARMHLELAQVLADDHRLPEALAEAREAVELDPYLSSARYGLASVLELLGRLDEASVEYEKVLQIDPAHAIAHNRLGLILQQRGDSDEAFAHFSEAVRLSPDFAEAHNNLGVALEMRGERGQAVEHFREALRLNPGFTDARENLDAVSPGSSW